MKHEAEIKELLISNAINLVAEGGFEKATTKELAFYGGNLADVKMNEVYIYRFFGNKERLFDAAFRQLDTELFYAIRSGADGSTGFCGNIDAIVNPPVPGGGIIAQTVHGVAGNGLAGNRHAGF